MSVTDRPAERTGTSKRGTAAAAAAGRGRAGRVLVDLVKPLAVYGVVKAAGLAVFLWLLHYSREYRNKPIGSGGGGRPWDVLGTWDGWWYQDIASRGYHPQVLSAHAQLSEVRPNSAAFFPLYPGLMRGVSEITGLGVYGAGILISVVASFVAAAGIFMVVRLMGGTRAGVVATGLWGLAPGSGAEWAIYSDSLFVALASWACWAVMTRRWLTAGTLAFVAGFNRPTSAAIIAAVGLSALIALFRRKDGVLRPLTAMLIAPWGFLGYLAWVGWAMGRPTGYFMIQRSWNHYFDAGKFMIHAIPEIMIGRFHYLWPWPLADMFSLAVLMLVPALLFLLLRRRPPLVLIVFTLLTIASTVTSQQIFSNVPRYLLPAFPLWIPVALALQRLKWTSLAPVLLFFGAASGWYAGYLMFQLGTP